MSHPESTALHGATMRAPQLPGPADSRNAVKGGFRFTPADGRWWWSPGMYMLLGVAADDQVRYPPSTRLLLTHLPPQYRQSLARAWRHLRAGHGPVAFAARIVGLDGVTRPVFITASADGDRDVSVVSGVISWETSALPRQRAPR